MRPATAIFVPRDQERFGAPPDMVRCIVYALCNLCFRLPDQHKRVERILFAQAALPDRN
jgi:hypothetical protein